MPSLQLSPCAREKCQAPLRALDRIRVEWSRMHVASLLLILALMPWALVLSGCSTALVRPESHADSAAEPVLRRAEINTHRRHVLLAAPAPPDCEYRGSDADAVDTDLWERLKLDYQQHCYQHAEALVRNRLRQLQVSGLCEVRVVHRSRFVRLAPPF
jgi:hypothetical protein